VAAQTGHDLGCYYSVCAGASDDTFRATYIHSKVMAVDDRFLTVGSANFTNRSMGLDSELHASWEVREAGDRKLARCIRRVRVSLLAEHSGASGVAGVRRLAPIDGLVRRLDENAARPGARLLAHGPPTAMQKAALSIVDPEDLPFDPETSEAQDRAGVAEPADERRQSRWRRGARTTR
jgi:phosphatidylserine/phosphatidylglycerophosphate/cardiolipin synthase-like enzyme